MTKKEIATKYKLHIFVALIFVITLLFVSLGWYYRDKTREEDLTNQKIFVDPRKRLMTLSDDHDEVGLLLNAENPLTLHWNDTLANHLCVVSNFSGPLYGLHQEGRLPHMNYTLCNGPNAKETHSIMKGFLRGTQDLDPLPRDVFSAPHWSVKGASRQEDYDQQQVSDIVTTIKTHGLNCSVLLLDGEWQGSHGDFDFDSDRFANLTNMTDHALPTCTIGLEVTPYFDYRSVRNFHEGVDKELFVKDAGGDVPGLTRWSSGGAMAILDVSQATSRAWFNGMMTRVVGRSKARSVRLSYGDDGWLPYKPTFSDASVSLFKVRRMMAEMMSRFTDRLILEHSSDSQNLPGLMAVPTDTQVKNGRSCLSNAIEKALTLGVLGYPYVMADGFSMSRSGQSQLSPLPSRDLFTRWMQMAAFFPAYKFSVPPWLYDEDTIALARNLSRLHSELVVPTMFQKDLAKEVASGLPILRPIWWLNPGNRTLHAMHVHDQFLVGETLLVAPVLCEGVTQRSIYIPEGVWDDRLRGALVLGPRVIEAYRVEQNEVPHFVQMKTYEDLKREL
nr:hypothetical protein BaRGS_012622 [Batillaria attramentaria]